MGGKSPIQIFKSSLSINLNWSPAADNNHTRASFSLPLQKSLLESLRSLHGFQTVSITGPLDEQSKADLCSSIGKDGPNYQTRLSKVLDKVREGNEAFNGPKTAIHYRRAIAVYNNAMTELKDECSRLFHSGEQAMGLAPTLSADDNLTYGVLVFKLQIKLATAHFRLGQYTQSLRWSNNALNLEDYDYSAYTSDADRGKAFLLLARSNNRLGRWEEAVDWMGVAVEKMPHLEPELETFKGDVKVAQEIQVETVKIILNESRVSKGRQVVVRYPSDFDKVKARLYSQRSSNRMVGCIQEEI